MSNFWELIKRHNSTYYDYETNQQYSVWWRYTLVSLIALVLVWCFEAVPSNMLEALLTVQSILIGFGFSVMFFLLSGSIPDLSKDGSIEAELIRNKLNRLSKELFHNVSYFNMVALISVVFSLFMLLPRVDVNSILNLIEASGDRWRVMLTNMLSSIKPVSEFILYATLIESLTSFARTIGRVSFYFERRLKIETLKK